MRQKKHVLPAGKQILSLLLTLAIALSLLLTTALATGENSTVQWAGAMNFNDANNHVTNIASVTSVNDTELKWAYALNTTTDVWGAYYAGQTVIVGDYLYATGGGKLHKVDIKTGEGEILNNDAGTTVNYYDYLCYADGVLILATQTKLEAFSLEGKSLGSVAGSYGFYHPVQYHGGYVICNGYIYKLVRNGDSVTFTQIGSSAIGGDTFNWSSGVFLNDLFYVVAKQTVYAVDYMTGQVKYSYVFDEKRTATSNTQGGAAYDVTTGRLFWGTYTYNTDIHSIKINSDGSIDSSSYLSANAGQKSICTPAVYNGRVYLAGQSGKISVLNANTLETIYTASTGESKIQSTPILSTANNSVRVYVQGYKGNLYVLADGETSGEVTQVATAINYTGVKYANAFEQIAMDNSGNIYCYNESGYLFCYGKSACAVPQFTTDLSTTQVKLAEDSTANALKVEATVSDDGTLSYQWQSSADKLAWTDIGDANESSYTPPTDTVGTAYYRCVVTNTKGENAAKATSSVAEVLVKVLGMDATLTDIKVSLSNAFGSSAKTISPTFSSDKTAYLAADIAATAANTAARVWAKPTDSNATISFTALYNVGKSTSAAYEDGTELTKTATTSGTGAGYFRTGTLYYGSLSGYAAVKITVTAEDGEHQKDYVVVYANSEDSVTTPMATEISLSKTTLSLANAEVTETLSATVKGQIGTGDCAVTWTSSNEAVATVSESGVVSYVSNGTATITASSGLASASCEAFCGTAAEPISVYVTIADKGEVVMGYQAITVTDRDLSGDFTVDEVLYAAHEAAYTGGAAAGYASYMGDWGPAISKLWGDTSYCFGYWNDHASCYSLADTVKANGYVVAFVYKNSDWSDAYSKFTADTCTTTVETAFRLKLQNVTAYDTESYAPIFSDLSGASLTVYDSSFTAIDSSKYSVADNGDGSYSVTISNAGTYYVVASSTEPQTVPAVCKVTVNAKQDGTTTPDSITVYISITDPDGKTYLSKTKYTVEVGTTVYELLCKTGLNITTSTSTSYGVYIEAIEGLGEFDEGNESGWMYSVNGNYPEYSSDSYELSDGDYVKWLYTRELGEDISGGVSAGAVTAEDREAAREAKALINSIGTVTKDSANAIKAAREAYDSLTDKQKALVPNYDVLTAAEAEYAKLTNSIIFTDVPEGAWYTDALLWAVKNGITTGSGATTFSPDMNCTRSQMVMFLWRAAGCPKSTLTDHDFTDVPKGAWYTDALLWAVENGITTGSSATTFSPDTSCTRSQMVTFLYRCFAE